MRLCRQQPISRRLLHCPLAIRSSHRVAHAVFAPRCSSQPITIADTAARCVARTIAASSPPSLRLTFSSSSAVVALAFAERLPILRTSVPKVASVSAAPKRRLAAAHRALPCTPPARQRRPKRAGQPPAQQLHTSRTLAALQPHVPLFCASSVSLSAHRPPPTLCSFRALPTPIAPIVSSYLPCHSQGPPLPLCPDSRVGPPSSPPLSLPFLACEPARRSQATAGGSRNKVRPRREHCCPAPPRPTTRFSPRRRPSGPTRV